MTAWRRHFIRRLYRSNKHLRIIVAVLYFVTLWGPLFCNFWHPGTLTLRTERRRTRMSKITNEGLTGSGTGCFIAVSVWQQWASKGFKHCILNSAMCTWTTYDLDSLHDAVDALWKLAIAHTGGWWRCRGGRHLAGRHCATEDTR